MAPPSQHSSHDNSHRILGLRGFDGFEYHEIHITPDLLGELLLKLLDAQDLSQTSLAACQCSCPIAALGPAKRSASLLGALEHCFAHDRHVVVALLSDV